MYKNLYHEKGGGGGEADIVRTIASLFEKKNYNESQYQELTM